jgi:8-oxo-dGTP pyrophosphatase MutT (NUDIX family)
MNLETKTPLVYCAGGLVWRDGEQGREVLLILSRDDQAWKFPKGHIDETDPGWDAAALREVREETGYVAEIIGFAGYISYPVVGRRGTAIKVVLYWHMTPVSAWAFMDSDEIEHCEWLPVRAALDRLTFLNDKQFLLKFITDERSRGE